MGRVSIFAGLTAVCIFWGLSFATVRHVPEDYPTVQEGIDAAVDGDTVLVAAGNYSGDGNRDIDFSGKTIIVMSEEGPLVTIIDCEGSFSEPHRGFYFHSGESTASVVKGFTITGGYAAFDWSGESGGGIYCEGSSPTITENRIVSNWTEFNGGGIYSDPNSSPMIIDNIISGNTAENTGGGIWCDNASVLISGNMISNNTGVWAGGGINIDVAQPTIEYTVITGNTSYWGGGIFCFDASPIITNSTITMNASQTVGGGIYCFYGSSPEINNTILWDDTPDEMYVDFGDPQVTYSDIQGGWPGEGNLEGDPMFVLPDKLDFRLLWDSPCIDAGDTSQTDPDGTRSDIGTFPFDQSDYMTLYMTPDTIMVTAGGELGITYTAINRWMQPEMVWFLANVTLPGGASLNVIGPRRFTIPADFTAQVHVSHPIPSIAPSGVYVYESMIGIPPSDLYDMDSFEFVIEP